MHGDTIYPVIVNAVLFNNEYELLRFRMNYYKNVFEKIVLITSDRTFSGSEKPEYDPSCVPSDKSLEVIVLDKQNFNENDYLDRWPVEYSSRTQLISHVAKRYPESIIIHTDADEFPSIEQVNQITINKNLAYGTIPLKTLYRNANWRSLGVNKTCSAVSFFRADLWSSGNITTSHGRYIGGVSVDGEFGSHFSYLSMGSKEISSKMSSFSHSEFDLNQDLYDFLIPLADTYAVDHLGRARETTLGLLRIEKQDELNSVQLAALEFNSDWFKINPPKQNIFARIAASIVITKALQNQRLNVFFPISTLGRLKLIVDFFWQRLIKKWRIILTDCR